MRTTFPVTVHLLFFRAGKILLSRRVNTGYMDGHYSVPAGHLEGNETVILAAIREALEETGLEIFQEDISFACVLHRNEDDERVDFFVRVNRWAGEPVNTEAHKCAELRWVKVNALPENTIPYVRQGIHNALTGIPYGEFGWDAIS
ncbi:MAG: NUDIX domain-containing protein [Chloroflexota bacterium]